MPTALPPPATTPLDGVAWLTSLPRLSEAARERRVLDALRAGQTPPWTWVEVPVHGDHGLVGTIRVAPDDLAVGTTSPVRVPLSARAASQLATSWGMALPTRKVMRAVHEAGIHVPLTPFSPAHGETRNATRLWLASNAAIEARRAGRTGLLVDHSKNVVLAAQRPAAKIAIFGGTYADGEPVQPLSTIHAMDYVDYSQKVRLVHPVMKVGDREVNYADVLRSAELHSLASDDGVYRAQDLGYA